MRRSFMCASARDIITIIGIITTIIDITGDNPARGESPVGPAHLTLFVEPCPNLNHWVRARCYCCLVSSRARS